MYRIVSEGKLIAICEKPRYVKIKESSGAWVQTTAKEAEAIAVKGDLYGFNGHEVEGRPKASVFETDSAEWVYDNYVQDNDYKAAIASLEDALCEMDAGASNV